MQRGGSIRCGGCMAGKCFAWWTPRKHFSRCLVMEDDIDAMIEQAMKPSVLDNSVFWSQIENLEAVCSAPVTKKEKLLILKFFATGVLQQHTSTCGKHVSSKILWISAIWWRSVRSIQQTFSFGFPHWEVWCCIWLMWSGGVHSQGEIVENWRYLVSGKGNTSSYMVEGTVHQQVTGTSG